MWRTLAAAQLKPMAPRSSGSCWTADYGVPVAHGKLIFPWTDQGIVSCLEAMTGKTPTGWLGPGRGQTFETLDYATDCGFTWFGDWVLDDQPLWVKTAHGPILSIPYSAEINDITLMVTHHHESEVLLSRTRDAFDRLYAESAESTRILAIGVHPYVSGAAHRIKYFEELLAYINRHDVVHWTGQQIYDWYATQVPKPA